MNRLRSLLDRYTQARADLDASNAEVRRASVRRLAELLASEDAKALVAGIGDPALTTYDRRQLEHAIADRLPKRRRQKGLITFGRLITWSLRHASYHSRTSALLTILPSLMIPVAFMAWRNTATEEVFFNQPWDFVWQYPDGRTQTILISAGTGLVAMPGSRADVVTLRFWNPQVGYLVTDVAAPWLDKNASVWKGMSSDDR